MRLVVIGGGAAGFFCAVNAARIHRGLEVIIVEKTSKLLSKVRISGGGRCNVTHACFSIPEILKRYPRGANFVKKTFHEFFTEDTIAWFKERGVLLKTESDGRMFPATDSSETIINCLLREADKYKVKIQLNKEVKTIIKKETHWQLTFANGENILTDYVCIACGGYPKAAMFDWITSIGHNIEPPVPSLFTFNVPGNSITELMGVSSTARVKIKELKLEEEGPVLITHWGLSGPAVLKLSARGARELFGLNYLFTAQVNWCTEFNEQSIREEFSVLRSSYATQKVINKNKFGLPQRLWDYLCRISDVSENMRWAELTSSSQNKLIKNICAQELNVEGKTTFKEEFVTAGGIKLSEVNAATMESKIVPGLFFAGEILDVDGVTGGFNFQHAWTSGWISARSIIPA